MTCKIFSISDDTLLVRAKRQNFKKKHGLVDWNYINLPLIRIFKTLPNI